MSGAEDVRIRPATVEDVDAVRAFGSAVIPPHYEPLIGAAAADRQVRDWWSASAIRRAATAGAITVAESGDGVVGVAQVSAHERPPVVYKLYVAADRRGRGVGVRLLRAVEAALPADVDALAIEHFAANERAGRFYEREGFLVDEVRPDPSGDPRLAVVWRIKPLR